MPPGDGGGDLCIGERAAFQHGLHQPLIAQGQRLIAGVRIGAKIHEALAQAVGQLGQQSLPPGAGQVHFIDKYKRRDAIPTQQPPQRLGVALDAVGAGDDQHGVVQYLQRALGLGGKIHMAGGIQQGDGGVFHIQERLLGKNGDAPGLFQRIGVEEGVLMVHPAQLADGAGAVEHGLREGGLAGIDVGQDAHHQPLGSVLRFCLFHLPLLTMRLQ